jgi:preprotein translocase subunit SecF
MRYAKFMSKRNAIITLIFITILIGVFFLYLYCTNKLALDLAKESVPLGEKQLTPEEKKEQVVNALEKMKGSEDDQITIEEKEQIVIEALERMKEKDSQDNELTIEEKEQMVLEALQRMKANQ